MATVYLERSSGGWAGALAPSAHGWASSHLAAAHTPMSFSLSQGGLRSAQLGRERLGSGDVEGRCARGSVPAARAVISAARAASWAGGPEIGVAWPRSGASRETGGRRGCRPPPAPQAE